MNTYTAVLQKTRGGYTAWVEQMPNVISAGRTKTEAEINLRVALELMLEPNRFMGLKDAVGDIERVSIEVRQFA